MPRRGSNFLDAARQILQERGEPMRGEEIVHIGLERGLFTTRSPNEEAACRSLINTLNSEITRHSNERGFARYGHSMFGLEEWGDSRQPSAAHQPRRRSALPPMPVSVGTLGGITLDKLERIRQVMAADEFRRDWGDIYDQLLAAERAKAITPINDRYLLERIRPVIQRIQDFLQGRGNESPKSETVCDWIFLCYTAELHREGAALWRYVNQDEVNPWQYERTAKFSTVCRVNAGL